MGVLHVLSAHTLQGGCNIVSPISLPLLDNSKSNCDVSSSCTRCCPGERYIALVTGFGVGNSSHILQ